MIYACASSQRAAITDRIAATLVAAVCLVAGCGDEMLIVPDALTLQKTPSLQTGSLSIGAAETTITPTMPVFLAGAMVYRPALAVHDALYARTMVIDDGVHRIGIVSVDLLGIDLQTTLQIRRAAKESAGIDYVLVAATHTHSGPDVLSMWSPKLQWLKDPYIDFFCAHVVDSLIQANAARRSATLYACIADVGGEGLVQDTRAPRVIDRRMTCLRAIDDNDETIATIVNYATHPILVPAISCAISADFVGVMCDAISSGTVTDAGETLNGVGGVTLFLNGALAGKITPAQRRDVDDRGDFGFGAARVYGQRMADAALRLLSSMQAVDVGEGLCVRTRRIAVPVDNALLDALTSWRLIRSKAENGVIVSEVGVVAIGDVTLFAVPGMIFPELVIGGIATQVNSDFPDAPHESPTLHQQTSAMYPMAVSLANDTLGYFIPRCQWDGDRPWMGDAMPYGEMISLGPDAAGIVVDAFDAITSSDVP